MRGSVPQALQQAVVVAARRVLPTGYKSAPFPFKNQISHGAESGGDLSALNQREPAPADKPRRSFGKGHDKGQRFSRSDPELPSWLVLVFLCFLEQNRITEGKGAAVGTTHLGAHPE